MEDRVELPFILVIMIIYTKDIDILETKVREDIILLIFVQLLEVLLCREILHIFHINAHKKVVVDMAPLFVIQKKTMEHFPKLMKL